MQEVRKDVTLQTPTLAELRELREYVDLNSPNDTSYRSNASYGSAVLEWQKHLATIDCLIASHPDTEGEKQG